MKSIELVGFKSFKDRTKLEFEPGMTAIVGPNGCGKSNISDAIRWVLGEQSAKALRGGKIEDCIFSGTDTHKPLSLAEVSLNLAECEASLGTEYNEITISRRVLRSGEGQYFLNKTPCRLKDIQRLFMDTGIGTNAYSVMEQGKIDQILSARPDDRRAVFEEASGITKYKADKKEAIRKLDHTEANLLRLEDIIKEVKRQIISLQRQAGKARRYKSLQDKLRGYDIFFSREELQTMDREVQQLEARTASISEQDEAARAEIEELEAKATSTRERLAHMEEEIAAAMDAAVKAQTDRDRADQLIQVNEDRINELQELSQRDSRDADEARRRKEHHQTEFDQLLTSLQTDQQVKEEAERTLEQSSSRLVRLDEVVESTRNTLHDLRVESIDLESHISKRQNELSDVDASERSAVIRKERLAAEQSGMERAVEVFAERQETMAVRLDELRRITREHEAQFRSLSDQQELERANVREAETRLADLRVQAAAKEAQYELLLAASNQDSFPAGARALLDGQVAADTEPVRGALADLIHADGEYQTALETVLRSWLDAVVVHDAASGRRLLGALQQQQSGSARLLAAAAHGTPSGTHTDGPGEKLMDHLRFDGSIRPLVERLLGRVRVVHGLREIPDPVPASTLWVTRSGALARDDGTFEWWAPDASETNPLTRKHLMNKRQQEAQELQQRIRSQADALLRLQSDTETTDISLASARAALEESQRNLALQEGEEQVIAQEANQARERADTVSFELQAVLDQEKTGASQRDAIIQQIEQVKERMTDVREKISSHTLELRELEQERVGLQAEVTEHRVQFAETRQALEHSEGKRQASVSRISELDALIENRASDLNTYAERIAALQHSTEEARSGIEPMKEEIQRRNQALESSRGIREEQSRLLQQLDESVRQKRLVSDELRSKKSKVDIELTQQRMRRQTLVERVTGDYHITPEQIFEEPEPEWEEGQRPDAETLETVAAEIKAKLESMGPVNLVAIEEHQELEERYTFLTQQYDDLVKAKQQLMDLIRRINKTTTEMFSRTFDQVNSNFQENFKKLFGGGSAKLVLVDEEDMLESGIEIIARPPGKQLQTVSLLSGGERTMTAVALLFSLYEVKPSPFCVLDELDAALDDANIGRFVTMVKDFLKLSQFLVITHNRQTIEAADCLYGVTMEERGISKIVSVKLQQRAAVQS